MILIVVGTPGKEKDEKLEVRGRIKTIVKIGLNTQESPGNLKCALIQPSVKDH